MFTISWPICKMSYKNQASQGGVIKQFFILHFYQNTKFIHIWTMEYGLDMTTFLSYSRLSHEMFQALYIHQCWMNEWTNKWMNEWMINYEWNRMCQCLDAKKIAITVTDVSEEIKPLRSAAIEYWSTKGKNKEEKGTTS